MSSDVLVRAEPDAILTLPVYPECKPLELGDKAAVESCTHRLPCSSDHNFTSLWMWNFDEQTRIARIGRNLVIEFSDFDTREPILTLIGDDDIAGTVEHLFSLGIRSLDLVPEFVADLICPNQYMFDHDPGHDDYVLDVELLARMPGAHFREARRLAGLCAREIELNGGFVSDVLDLDQFVPLFERWAKSRNKSEPETRYERMATERIVAGWDTLNLRATAIYARNTLIAAEVYELLPDGAIAHCRNVDAAYRGLFPFLQKSNCEHLAALGVAELNVEEDLGLPGLRAAKLRCRPRRFVRKPRVLCRA
jgi:hypothetical protein